MSTVTFRSLVAAVTTFLVLISGPALSTERKGAYVGGGLGAGTADLSDDGLAFTDNSDNDIVIVEGHGGYRFNSYFALEGQILGAANDSDNDYQDSSFGGISGRALAIAPVSGLVDLYALVGFYSGSSEVGNSDAEDESGAAYGGGIQLNFGARGQFGIRGEYEVYQGSQLLDDIKGFTVSFQYNFFR